ncbi:hypothetical protein [Ciceribacter lividus]|nr:hypothetical protein [Ciceribacter lividus]
MSNELKAALYGAVAGSFMSAVIGFGFQYLGDDITIKKTARLETVLDYTKVDSPITPIAARYISVLTDGGEIAPVQIELRGKLADEILRAEKLRSLFADAGPAIEQYQDALQGFSNTIDSAKSVTSMREWAENFGRVIDSRQILDNALLNEVGVGSGA